MQGIHLQDLFYKSYVKDTLALEEIDRLATAAARCKKSNLKQLNRAFEVLTVNNLVSVRHMCDRGQLLFLGTNTRSFKAAKNEVMA